MMLDLEDGSVEQHELALVDDEGNKRSALMLTMVRLNARYGPGTVLLASSSLKENNHAWSMRQELRTPDYMANWTDIPHRGRHEKIRGPGQVRVPEYLFKLVYDQDQHRAWAHWHLNDDATRASQPISYGELVRCTGIEFLPEARLDD